ncbi:UNVERIFIED_CONTAM: hypothetical protein GTU68_051363 [Idotea baltica]|nr:hypothetical protein [Idotea baltica]
MLAKLEQVCCRF